MKSKIINVKAMTFPWQTQDPFLLCVHHRDEYPKGNKYLGVDASELEGRNIGQDFEVKDGYRMYHGSSVPGFPYHPHRGFETVTIGKEGFVDHCDSLGGAGRFGSGDVEWMTAGSGIQHSEMFPLINQDTDNPLELFQIWLNLPSKSKFVKPHFKMLWEETIPKVVEEDEHGRKILIELFAGRYQSKQAPEPTPDSWAANPDNGVMVLTIEMEPHAEWILPSTPINGEVNSTLYFYKGNSIQVDDIAVEKNHLIETVGTENVTIINGETDAYILLLQGKPINEPIAQQGPFVMNTEEEIMQAFADYRKTQFGRWPWPVIDPVHGKNTRRFARYEDGTEEVK